MQTKINKFQKENPNLSKTEIAKRLGISRTTVNKYTKKYPRDKNLSELKNRVRGRMSKFLKSKGVKKNKKTEELLGCSFNKLKIHLGKQFIEGMNWENNTINGWHVDHIIPLSSAKTEKEMYRLFNYKNLQPLWAIDNIKKGCRIIT